MKFPSSTETCTYSVNSGLTLPASARAGRKNLAPHRLGDAFEANTSQRYWRKLRAHVLSSVDLPKSSATPAAARPCASRWDTSVLPRSALRSQHVGLLDDHLESLLRCALSFRKMVGRSPCAQAEGPGRVNNVHYSKPIREKLSFRNGRAAAYRSPFSSNDTGVFSEAKSAAFRVLRLAQGVRPTDEPYHTSDPRNARFMERPRPSGRNGACSRAAWRAPRPRRLRQRSGAACRPPPRPRG